MAKPEETSASAGAISESLDLRKPESNRLKIMLID